MWLTLCSALALALEPGPRVVVRSASACPGADEIMAAMAPLLPAGAAAAASGDSHGGADLAELSVENGSRWLRLRAGDGRLVQERALPDSLPCADAARAAAVLVATWEFQGRVEMPPEPVTPPPPPQPRPQPPADAAVSSSARPSPPPVVAAPAVAAPALPPPPSQRRLAAGAGVAAAWATGQLATSALFELAFVPRDGAGLRAHGALTAQQSLDVGVGRATWRRSSLGVGGVVAGHSGAWGGQGHADLIGALLSISGEGFPMNRDGSQLALGILVGARATRALGRTELWLDGGLTIWPGRHELIIGNAPQTRDLAGYEVGLGLGLDYFVWP